MPQRLSIEQLVDGRGLGLIHWNVLVWTFLALFTDGYDISVLAYAAPGMVRQWHVDPATLGPVLSASLIGMFVGAPLLGSAGDRWGRKRAIVAGCAIYGLATLVLIGVTDIREMAWWRFLAGIGIGGLMPNATALMVEVAPKRVRAALVVVMFTGTFLGGAAPSLVVSGLVPIYGVQALFLVGGAIPLLVGAAASVFLPESPKFLVQRRGARPRLLHSIRRLRPDLAIDDDAEIYSEAAPAQPAVRGTFAQLFGPGLAAVTLLVWLCYTCSLMTMYFLQSWLPLIFERNGILPADAAWITALYNLGAIGGSFAVMGLLDRFGFLAVAALFISSAPAIVLLGLPRQSLLLLATTTTLVGFLSQTVVLTLNAVIGVIYPTEFRSKAVGCALAVGRVGSIAGPMLGAVAFGMHLPLAQLFVIPAVPMIIGGSASAALACLLLKRNGTFRIKEVAA